jgi:tetratricopeptide (TPR) repeat protein
LALNEKRVEDAARISDRALQLNPTGVPAIYFLNGMAHYNLGHVDVAERAVRRAIEIDINHDIPRAEGLLGSVLATKGDRRGAIEHFRKYLALAPQAPDAAAVGRIVEELERGTAAK